MILDCHVHIMQGLPIPDQLLANMRGAGVRGGIIISHPPQAYSAIAVPLPPAVRLENLMLWTAKTPDLFPFFWIDPLESDALEQVKQATERGVAGFKIMCNTFDPGDPRAMPIYEAIAKTGKPLLFHSGILWNGMPSSNHNRPALFEPLMEVAGLRFALAHISWPWVDECIAVYGKFQNAYQRRPDLSSEMFIDLTPGTPVIYRKEALTKLLTVGYDIESNLLFGTDCRTDDYDVSWASEWIARDGEIYQGLGIGSATFEKIFSQNLLRFLGAE